MFEPAFVDEFMHYLKSYCDSHLEEQAYYEFPNNYALRVYCKHLHNFNVIVLYKEEGIWRNAYWVKREDLLKDSGSISDKDGVFYSLDSWEVLYLLKKIKEFPNSQFLK